MDITQFPQLNPPSRLLMGPGPINADPRVLRAMSSQLIGQYDPAMTHYMNEVMALYRGVFRTENRWTMLVDGTSRAGIEAILVSAIRPGDKVLVPVFGRFGHLLCEIARRCRAEVHTIEVPWGEVFTPDQVEDAIKRIRPRLLLTVQGDTSTTMLQPLAELGDICRRYDVLFYTDATASLGGNPLETDAWGWMRSRPGCRSASAARPAPRRLPSARAWKRRFAAANAWKRGSAPMPTATATRR
jgi:(S)-ureidoglycine-glyoxylate aminotransferase